MMPNSIFAHDLPMDRVIDENTIKSVNMGQHHVGDNKFQNNSTRDKYNPP